MKLKPCGKRGLFAIGGGGEDFAALAAVGGVDFDFAESCAFLTTFASLMAADNKLIILSSQGQLVIADASRFLERAC